MRLLAIDPGPEQSAYVLYDVERRMPGGRGKVPNDQMLEKLGVLAADTLAIEMIASYGMAVGADVFETCVWVGRFIQRYVAARPSSRMMRVYRRDVKLHLCGSNRAKDANIRQALIDRYGPGKEAAIGRKATPGPLYGLTGDCWSALGVAVTCAETRLVEVVA